MLEGKRFFPETGIPILKIALKIVLLAVELPDPFLEPTIIEKSLITLSMILLNVYGAHLPWRAVPGSSITPKFTVGDTKGRCGGPVPDTRPRNYQCKSLPPFPGGIAILLPDTHSLPQKH